MDRKIRKKITNVLKKNFNFFWNRPDPTQKETGPRSAKKIQIILCWARLSPAAWTGLMIEPGLVTMPMHNNQSNTISRLLCSCTVTG